MPIRRPVLSMLVAGVCLSAVGYTNDLIVARQALRDGLYEVARNHARKAPAVEALPIILESFAAEGRWDEVKKTLNESNPDLAQPVIGYYAAVVAGDFAKAAKLLKSDGSIAGVPEAKMLEAENRMRSGDAEGAAQLWREVTADTNASDRAFVNAAVSLGEEAPLRAALKRRVLPALHRSAGLKLGTVLIREPGTLAEGEKLIRSVVKDSPDSSGAREAFVSLAAAQAAAGLWKESAASYAELQEIWPDASGLFQVQSGRGWVLQKLGRREEAYKACCRAGELAKTDAEKALAAYRTGEALADLGRGAEAMAKYREVLGRFPETEIAVELKRIIEIRELETKGRAFYKDFRFADAAADFLKVAEADPTRKSRMDYFNVLCLYGQGMDVEAKKNARLLAEKCPDAWIRAEAMLWLAKFTYNRGEWKESAALFSDFVNLAPDHVYAPQALVWATRAAFSDDDANLAIQLATRLAESYPASPCRHSALLVQGESLMELARFDAAVLVFEGIAIASDASESDRLLAKLLKADSLFAMGADNQERYLEALEAYRGIRFGDTLEPSRRISVSFKIARTLEKLGRHDEAEDEYYSKVLIAYRDGRLAGVRYDDDARAAFSKAALRLADEFESRGKDMQAIGVLNLLAGSDVQAAEEAEKRIDRISTKGRFL